MAIDKVVCCENNHRFRLGISGDGYRNCPECNRLLKEVPADVTKGEPFTLQYLSQAFIKRKESKSSARNLSIDVAMNTDNLQLKLRAIEKHVGALADELDAIDNRWECPNCGESNYNDCFRDNTLEHRRLCKGCNHSFTGEYIQADELPTRLEGSQ